MKNYNIALSPINHDGFKIIFSHPSNVDFSRHRPQPDDFAINIIEDMIRDTQPEHLEWFNELRGFLSQGLLAADLESARWLMHTCNQPTVIAITYVRDTHAGFLGTDKPTQACPLCEDPEFRQKVEADTRPYWTAFVNIVAGYGRLLHEVHWALESVLSSMENPDATTYSPWSHFCKNPNAVLTGAPPAYTLITDKEGNPTRQLAEQHPAADLDVTLSTFCAGTDAVLFHNRRSLTSGLVGRYMSEYPQAVMFQADSPYLGSPVTVLLQTAAEATLDADVVLLLAQYDTLCMVLPPHGEMERMLTSVIAQNYTEIARLPWGFLTGGEIGALISGFRNRIALREGLNLRGRAAPVTITGLVGPAAAAKRVLDAVRLPESVFQKTTEPNTRDGLTIVRRLLTLQGIIAASADASLTSEQLLQAGVDAADLNDSLPTA